MPKIEDMIPFKKMGKDLADKIEEKRQASNEFRKKRGLGTFRGFEDAIARRKQEAENAKRNRY